MPYRPGRASGNPAYVDFGGTVLAGLRAFAWSSTAGVPVLANGTTTHVAGVTDRSGKGGWLAIPGLLVEIEVGGGSDISIGSLYNIDGVGSLSSAGGGTHFKAWQAMSSGQSFNRVILAEVWKPKG